MLINSNKYMNLKNYQKWRMGIVFILAMAISQSVIRGNYIIPIMLMVVASLALWYLRGQVKEVLADERDYALGGKAALLSIQAFGWFAVILMFALYSKKEINSSYEIIAATLSYSVLFLFLIYSLIFRYYNKFKFQKGYLYLAAAILLMVIVTIIGIRLFSGEDNWICQNGQWQKNGQPDFPAPQTECK